MFIIDLDKYIFSPFRPKGSKSLVASVTVHCYIKHFLMD